MNPRRPQIYRWDSKVLAVWKRHHYEETLLKLLGQKQSERTLIEYTFSVLSHCHSKLDSFRLPSWYASLKTFSSTVLPATPNQMNSSP